MNDKYLVKDGDFEFGIYEAESSDDAIARAVADSGYNSISQMEGVTGRRSNIAATRIE